MKHSKITQTKSHQKKKKSNLYTRSSETSDQLIKQKHGEKKKIRVRRMERVQKRKQLKILGRFQQQMKEGKDQLTRSEREETQKHVSGKSKKLSSVES